MPRCQAQRGFLALRSCGGQAVASCGACNRAVCGEHLVDNRCTECAAAGEDWRTDPRGPTRFRRRFYEQDSWIDSTTLYWGYERYGFTGGPGFDETASEGSSWDS